MGYYLFASEIQQVLTSRIAHMMQTALSPWPTSTVWALTFSNKAAKEMSERLRHLGVQNVTLGTFHSVCAILLRKHGRKVGLDPSFTICDSDDR
jgi:DNA helicase-2/ATP-dependent DNA helicase PcrA